MNRFVVAVTLGILIVTTVPYGYGYLAAGTESHFTGIVFDVPDTAQYFAWMRSFSHEVIIANPLTPEPGEARFFNLQWWLLGLLAFKTPLGPVLVYQVLRIVALIGFAAALAGFCRLAAPQRPRLAFLIAMLGSGFGWALVLLKYVLGESDVRYPLDIHVGEANAFFSAMAFPHLLVAGALLITIFLLFLGATGSNQWRYSAALIPVTLCLGFSHGYDLIPAMAIPGMTAVALSIRDRRISTYVVPATAIMIGAIPPALYSLALTRLDSTWQGVLSQYGNAGVFSPSPPHLIILLGLPALLALPQLRPGLWKTASTPGLFVRTWAVVGFFLLYIPTDYQIKMLIGYQVPVAILAAATLAQIPQQLARFGEVFTSHRLQVASVALFLGCITLTNVYLTGWRIVDLRRADYPYYLANTDVRALQELEHVAGKHDVVLSSPEIGVFVPVYSDSRPYVAHWAQTLKFLERRDQAGSFYQSGTTSGSRAAFLQQQGIDFVLSGPAENDGPGESPPVILDLEVVVQGATMLYRSSPEMAR